MLFFDKLLIFLAISVFSFCCACELNLAEYTRTKDSPSIYTLALMDGSMVLNAVEDVDIPKEVRPFIHSSINSNSRLTVKTFLKKDSYPQHFLVELKHKKGVLRSALLTESLLKEEDGANKDGPCSQPTVEDKDDQRELHPVC